MFYFEFEVGCELIWVDVGIFFEYVFLLLSDIIFYFLFILFVMGFIFGIGWMKFLVFLLNVSWGFSLFCLFVIVLC